MKSEIEVQRDNVNKLIKLMNDNPTLEVIPMVDSEVVSGDDFSWWTGVFGEPDVDEYYSCDERIYFRSWDDEELIDNILEDEDFIKETKHLNDDIQYIIAEQKVNNLPWEKVIRIRIGTH